MELAFCALVVTLAGSTLSAHSEPSDVPSLDLARQALARRMAGEPISTVGPVSLSAFNFFREIDLGTGSRVLVISTGLGGALIVYSSQGMPTALRRTDEIGWLGLADLTLDDVSEIITEETTSRGTGVLTKVYRVYTVTKADVPVLWTAESFHRSQRWRPDGPPLKDLERLGYLRIDGGTLFYLLRDERGRVLRNDRVDLGSTRTATP